MLAIVNARDTCDFLFSPRTLEDLARRYCLFPAVCVVCRAFFTLSSATESDAAPFFLLSKVFLSARRNAPFSVCRRSRLAPLLLRRAILPVQRDRIDQTACGAAGTAGRGDAQVLPRTGVRLFLGANRCVQAVELISTQDERNTRTLRPPLLQRCRDGRGAHGHAVPHGARVSNVFPRA
jgi:hypothetical protein